MIKEGNNVSTALKVLAHMGSRNVQPTAHIYTILMTYYFQLDPPDLRAADALWNQISNTPRYSETLDIIFYDRMVEGYARHGAMGKTMAFLTRMSKDGKRPGWLAMIAVIQCLASHREWDRLKQIVFDVQRSEGLLRAGVRGLKGQPEFWELVNTLPIDWREDARS